MQLPIHAVLEDLMSALSGASSVVLLAPPGAGKTTVVPLALYQAAWMRGERLIMLEPRRIAARAAASRMAAQLGEPVGKTVGYRTRFDSRISADTRIEVVTEGILTRMLIDDPSLEGYQAVIFDEFHERSLAADTGLALALEAQKVLRPDLRLLVMSATLDGGAVAALLGGAPVIEAQGRSYPVAMEYRPPNKSAHWIDHAAQVIANEAQDQHGSMLVFVPGVYELKKLSSILASGQFLSLPHCFTLHTLHGGLDAAAQDKVLSASPEGMHKIVIATAIAETSLTIAGVTLVIDAGYQRLPTFDAAVGMGRLETRRVSRSSADQRAGRAGRIAAGRAIRLWRQDEVLAAQAPAEMLCADLASLVLDLAQWGCVDPSTLSWLDQPPLSAWQGARELLSQLGLLRADGLLSDLGRECQRLPLHPRLAAMLCFGRKRQLGVLAAKLAVLLESRDSIVQGGVDLRSRLDVFSRSNRSSSAGVLRKQLGRLLKQDEQASDHIEVGANTAGSILLAGYPDRLAWRRPGNAARYRLRNGRGVCLADDDSLAGEPWLVAANVGGGGREPRIVAAAPIDMRVIEAYAGDAIEEEECLEWHQPSLSLRGVRRRHWAGLVLDEQSLPAQMMSDSAVQAALIRVLVREGLSLLTWSESIQQWLARVRCLHALAEKDWPDVSEKGLLARLDEWLVPFMRPAIKRRSWRGFAPDDALRALLGYAEQRRLEQLLPVTFAVPSGRHVVVDYCQGGTPIIRVKLQEMFGLHELPLLANGLVSLQAHLLSPAQRPIAVTSDLAGFWRHSYVEVRKEMRGRYPKHPWPQDPLTAVASARVKGSS